MSKYYHVRHPEQARAKWTVKNRIRSGKLVKPSKCECCGNIFISKEIEAHHWSYKKEHHGDPIWLCIWCHKKLHIALGDEWKDAPVRPVFSGAKTGVHNSKFDHLPDIY